MTYARPTVKKDAFEKDFFCTIFLYNMNNYAIMYKKLKIRGCHWSVNH